MITLLGILLGAAVIVIGIQGYMIAKLNNLTDRLLVANEQFGMATKQLVAINESIVSAAQDAQRLSSKALEVAKESDDRADKAIQKLKELTPQP